MGTSIMKSNRLVRWLSVAFPILLMACDSGPSFSNRDVLEAEAEDVDAEASTDIVLPTEDVWGAEVELPSDLAQPFIVEGKRLLKDGQSGRARDAFRAGMDVSPDSVDARFGLALSEMVYGAELFIMSTSLIGQLTMGRSDSGEPSHDEYVAGEIHRILISVREPFRAAADLLAELDGVSVRFEVEAVPVFLGLKPRLLYRGLFDEGDAILMRAVAATILGIFDTLAGQDFTTDLLNGVKLAGNDVWSGDIDAPTVIAVMTYLLNRDIRFLALESIDGPALFEDARARFGAAGPLLAVALDRIETLGDDENHVSWIDVTSGGVTLNVRSGIRYDPDGTAKEEVLQFDVSEATRAAFLDTSDSILNAGYPVTLHGGVLPVAVTILSALAKAGVLEALGVTLPLDLSALGIGDISSFVSGLLPNILAFDWGRFYESPCGLRTWLPSTTTNLGPMQDRFIMEWECAGDIQADGYPTGWKRLLCAKDAERVDATHFVSQAGEMAADGNASGFPVFLFPDPTESNLLLVDLNGTSGVTDASTYVLATGQTLNMALARMFEGLLALVPE